MEMLKKRIYEFSLILLMVVVAMVMLQPTEISAPVSETKKYVALTYDDGPSKISTKKLLDLLDKYEAKATFFINGNHANNYKDLVKDIVDRGNEIGNHTLDHVWLTKTDTEEVKRQIYGNENLLKFISGQEGEMLVRPPYGDINQNILDSFDVPFVMWSVDSRDWEVKDVGAIQNNVLNYIEDGDIIIMHDGYETTIQATEEVLIQLTQQGFEVVSVSDLFRLKNKEIPLHKKINKVT